MRAFFSETDVVVLDEAQTIPNIGRALKILIDANPNMNIIATGSSSFELANKINEPLTGRHYEYFLYPISFNEIAAQDGNRVLFEKLPQFLVFGTYPEILNAQSRDDRIEKLSSLTSSYLYRDIYKFQNIRNPDVLTKILKALAYQIGGEVSFTEIASLVGVDKNTVASYIRVLEQAFVIFRLPSFARNLRNEIKRGQKFYFYDNGIISALIENYSDVTAGRDIGALWENLMLCERLKYNQNHRFIKALYFWRTKGAGEIDLIEESNGIIRPFEFKWSKSKAKASTQKFVEAYGTKPVTIVNKENFVEFVR
jgi:predicted AAA+ superfamily ATPase